MVKHLFISSFDLLMHTEHKNKTGHAPILRRCKQSMQSTSHASLENVLVGHAPIFCWPIARILFVLWFVLF